MVIITILLTGNISTVHDCIQTSTTTALYWVCPAAALDKRKAIWRWIRVNYGLVPQTHFNVALWSRIEKLGMGLAQDTGKGYNVIISQLFISGSNIASIDVSIDGDNPDHIMWIFKKSQDRAAEYGIQGVTYRLTQGKSVSVDNQAFLWITI